VPEPAVPRDAATVMLLRDAAAGVEVYLLRRVKGMPFAGGMTAYPGGSVDPDDADATIGWVGPAAALWADSFGCSEPLARALVCAAVRETFEESGVLLAAADGVEVEVAEIADWEAERRALVERQHSLAELLTRRGLRLRADLLRPWAHWITPEDEPRRYDTRFFVAALPAGVAARDVSGEAEEAAWVLAADALAQNDRGERPMFLPTLVTLTDITRFSTVVDVLAAAPPGRLETVQPRLEYTVEGEFVVMPDGSRWRPPVRLGRSR